MKGTSSAAWCAPAGLANQKAPRIQAALRQIEDEIGELSLDFLAEMPLDEAKSWLTGIKGVGPKTAAIVLLFAFGRPAFPVDTHILRIARRIGWVAPDASPARTHDELASLIAGDRYYPAHINLITLGRELCRPRNPACAGCPLRRSCRHKATHVRHDRYQRHLPAIR